MKINIAQDKVEKLAFKDLPVNTMFIYSDKKSSRSDQDDTAIHIKISEVKALRIEPQNGNVIPVDFHQTNKWYFFRVTSINEISASLILL